jgi:hypothetical protein
LPLAFLTRKITRSRECITEAIKLWNVPLFNQIQQAHVLVMVAYVLYPILDASATLAGLVWVIIFFTVLDQLVLQITELSEY